MMQVLTQRLRSDEGSILVIAGIMLVATALIAAGIIQVGGWYQHRRHLQVRADAGALAGGQLFGECFANSASPAAPPFADPKADIERAASQYAGFATSLGTPFNTQFGGGTGSVLFQSQTYPGGGGGGPDTTDTGPECSNLSLDVKLTDSAIPSMFSFLPFGTVHAHARVKLQSIQSAKGAFPLAIPNVDPKTVFVTYVDEDSGNELTGCSGSAQINPAKKLCTFALTKGASANSVTQWTGAGTVVLPSSGVTSSTSGAIGVRVGLGVSSGSCANTAGGDGYSCFDSSDNDLGVVMIRDYGSGSGTPSAPVLQNLIPTNSCSPAWASQFSSSPFVSDAGNLDPCSVGVDAYVDFGAPPASLKAIVRATINGTTITLGPQSLVSGTTWLWTPVAGSASVPVDTNQATSGYPITMSWEEQAGKLGGKTCTTGGGNPCQGDFNPSGKKEAGAPVGRFTSATDDDQGPVKLISVTEGGAPAYSLTPGAHTLNVDLRLQGALGVQVPPVLQALRLTHTGSKTTAVDCDGRGNAGFDAAIENGCQTPYQVNPSGICPDPNPPDGPADCVPNKTGNLGSTFSTHLNKRFNNTCAPNNWPDYTKPGDPRVVLLMLTDFSALDGQGKTNYPVDDFADFYLMGWTNDPCGTPWPFSTPQPSGGNLWGYFVKYDSPGQVPSGQDCKLDEITPCVPVLVR